MEGASVTVPEWSKLAGNEADSGLHGFAGRFVARADNQVSEDSNPVDYAYSRPRDRRVGILGAGGSGRSSHSVRYRRAPGDGAEQRPRTESGSNRRSRRDPES